MNKRQIWVLWIGIIIIVAMLLFPPMKEIIPGDTYTMKLNVGYHFIFTPVVFYERVVDWGRLMLPIAAVIVIGLALLFTFKERKK